MPNLGVKESKLASHFPKPQTYFCLGQVLNYSPQCPYVVPSGTSKGSFLLSPYLIQDLKETPLFSVVRHLLLSVERQGTQEATLSRNPGPILLKTDTFWVIQKQAKFKSTTFPTYCLNGNSLSWAVCFLKAISLRCSKPRVWFWSPESSFFT